MGLDSYFYRITRPVDRTKPHPADLIHNVPVNDDLQELIAQLEDYAYRTDQYFENVLACAIQDYLCKNDSDDPYRNEVSYFRKFHFLNDYFNYTDENYAKDMKITREQCEDLLSRANECINDCLLHCGTYPYDEANCDNIADKHFPSKWHDSTYMKVQCLKSKMQSILDYTDWENEDIVYNADW